MLDELLGKAKEDGLVEGRGGQWCEGGEDSDVSEGRMRGSG